MKIYFATDHAGFELKNILVDFVGSLGYEAVDCGAFIFDKEDDYPDFISIAINNLENDLKNGVDSRAIIFGGSGQGEAIIANRKIGVRAGVYYGKDLEIVKLLREHNNANVLSLGARFISSTEAKDALKVFLETQFSSEIRHKRRVDKIDKI